MRPDYRLILIQEIKRIPRNTLSDDELVSMSVDELQNELSELNMMLK